MFTSNWMRKNEKVLPIGLDIGHSAIKMVQLALVDGGVRILAADRAPLDWEAVAEEEARRSLIMRTVRQLLTQGGFRGHDVISAVPSDELRITSLRLADAEMLEVDKTLRKEAAHRFGLNPRTDAIRHVLAGSVRQGDELKNEYILFAADDETIKSHIALLEETGLNPKGIDAGPCALFRNFDRMMRRQEDRECTIIFVDVGHRYTTVVFGRSGAVCFVKKLAFGAARFAEDIATKLEVSTGDVAALRQKMQSGESVDAATRRLVVDTLHGTAEQLAAEIALCLRYYTVTFRGKRVDRAIMAGGGSHETALPDVIKHHLAIETEVAEPLRGFDPGSNGLDGEHYVLSADYALAVGLSLKGATAAEGATADSMGQAEPVLEGARS